VLCVIVASGAMGTRVQAELGSEFNPLHLSDTIVVTANRLATPTSRVGSSVTVITADQIARSQATMVSEILRAVPGVSIVQSGGLGQQTSIFMRGANSEHVLVMIDGVEINDPSSPNNAANLANLPVDNIERIEVLRGPQSVLYGSDAIGGVIQILTRTGLGRPEVSGALEAGSLNTRSERLSVRGGTESNDYSVALSHRSTDAISATKGEEGMEKDGHDNTTLSGALDLRPTSKIQLRLTGHLTESDTDLDQGYGLVLDDPNYTLKSKEQFGSIRVEHDIARGLWRHQFGAYVTHYERSTLDGRDVAHPEDTSSTHYSGTRNKYDWQLAAAPREWLRLIAGAETEEDQLEQSLFYLPSWFGDPLTRLGEVRARTSGVYGMAESNLGAATITAGGRWDHHEMFGSHDTYRLTGLYRLSGVGLTIRATYGSGFKVPSLYQIHDAATGNPDLKPECSWGGEIGLEKGLLAGRLTFGTTYFHTHFGDLIQFRVFDPITFEGMMVNVAEARAIGWESFIGMAWGGAKVRLDHTYTEAIDRSAHQDLVRRPRRKFSLSADCQFAPTLFVGLGITYSSRREDIGGPTGRVMLADYAVVDLTGSWVLHKHVRLSARIGNLFDSEYEEVFRFNHTPRSVMVGLTLTS
jgi:vitamin B12 transporter